MPQTRPKPPEEDPAAPAVVAPAVPAKKLDEFDTPGGKFLVNGKLVNHEGQRIHEDGVPLTPDELAAEV